MAVDGRYMAVLGQGEGVKYALSKLSKGIDGSIWQNLDDRQRDYRLEQGQAYIQKGIVAPPVTRPGASLGVLRAGRSGRDLYTLARPGGGETLSPLLRRGPAASLVVRRGRVSAVPRHTFSRRIRLMPTSSWVRHYPCE